jgi:glycosyltransferase involved in cell wall biosynthesis
MRLVLELGKRLDVGQWEERARAGQVPGFWPYGLHHLRDEHDVVVNDTRALLTSSWPSLRGYDVPRWYRRPRGWQGADAVVSWEELTSITFPLRRRGDVPALCSGVIWSTDVWERRADRGLETRLTKDLLRRMDLLWCLSEAQADELSRRLSPAPQVAPLAFGIDTDFYRASPPEPTDRPLVVSAGGDRDRDIGVLLEAMELVRRRRPEADVVVQTRRDVRPPDGIRIVRDLTHTALRELYRRSAVVVLALKPNLHVSGMTVALEAMATGRPVVCSATPGMAEYVLDGVTGTLVAPGDAAALASATVEVLEDPSGRTEMGRRAAEHVHRRHGQGQMVRQLADLVSAAVRGRP